MKSIRLSLELRLSFVSDTHRSQQTPKIAKCPKQLDRQLQAEFYLDTETLIEDGNERLTDADKTRVLE